MRYSNEDIDNEELQRCIQETKRLKTRLAELGYKGSIDILSNVHVHDYKGEKVVTAHHDWSWDFYVGIGNTEDEAIQDLKPRINMYDREFDDYEYNFPPSYIKTR